MGKLLVLSYRLSRTGFSLILVVTGLILPFLLVCFLIQLGGELIPLRLRIQLAEMSQRYGSRMTVYRGIEARGIKA